MSALYDNQHITKTTVHSFRAQLETHRLPPANWLGPFALPLVDQLSSEERAEMLYFCRWTDAAERSTSGGFTLRDHLPMSRLMVAYQ